MGAQAVLKMYISLATLRWHAPLWGYTHFTKGGPIVGSSVQGLQAIKGSQPSRIPLGAREVHTPLNVEAWIQALRDHPNKDWVDSLLVGLRDRV